MSSTRMKQTWIWKKNTHMLSNQGAEEPADLLRRDLALLRHHLLLPPRERSLHLHLSAAGQHWPWRCLLHNAHPLRCLWPLLHGLQQKKSFAQFKCVSFPGICPLGDSIQELHVSSWSLVPISSQVHQLSFDVWPWSRTFHYTVKVY